MTAKPKKMINKNKHIKVSKPWLESESIKISAKLNIEKYKLKISKGQLEAKSIKC